MELRIYPEYVGTLSQFSTFLLNYFRKVQICCEVHTAEGEAHYHALLQEPYHPISPEKFKRVLQQYKKTITKKKFRNNSLHIANCENDIAFSRYLRETKIGGRKTYMSLRHPYDFDTHVVNIYSGFIF